MGHWSDVDILMQRAERRVKVLRISIPMLPLLLLKGSRWELVEHPLPADAEVVASRLEHHDVDPRHATLVLTVTSAEFPEAPESRPIPEMEPPVFHDPRPIP